MQLIGWSSVTHNLGEDALHIISHGGRSMKNISSKFIITGIFLAFFAFALPHSVTAQEGRYVNTYSKNQVKAFVDQLERSSKAFKKDFDRSLDQSNLRGTNSGDDFKERVERYKDSVEYLKNKFNGINPWWQNRNNVQDMLGYAEPVNSMMNNLSFARQLESQWRMLRDDINKIADTFDLPGINGGGWGGGWNGGGWNGSGGMTRPPSWAVGTFYAPDPASGQRITLVIAENGSVTSSAAGATSYGRYVNGIITMDGVNVRLAQINNGVRGTRMDNGLVVNYSRSNWGGGWNGGGNTSRPPSWAVGTFYAPDPASGQQITLVISDNGRVTSSAGGSMSYGTYNNDVITMDGVSVRVTKINNGVRGTRMDNGMVVNYSKNSWGNGGWNGGGSSNPPNWARGTFYTTDPATGDRITLVINNNGQVTSSSRGSTSYGTYRNDVISMEGVSVRVYRQGNGIRTVREDNGQTVVYSK